MDISEEARASINFTKKKNDIVDTSITSIKNKYDIVKEVEEPRATSVYNTPS